MHVTRVELQRTGKLYDVTARFRRQEISMHRNRGVLLILDSS